MDFVANDLWSAIWVVVLAIAGIATIMGEYKDHRRILWVLILNFIVTRACVTLWPSNHILWIANDAVTVVALALYGRTKAAMACASLFFIIVQLDLGLLMGGANFAPIAAMSDFLGYLVLIIMTGAAHGTGGRVAAQWRGTADRLGHHFNFVEGGRTVATRAGVLSRSNSKSASDGSQ
jgi:hypothetical protein